MSAIERPLPAEVFEHFQNYVGKAQGDELFAAFDLATRRLRAFADIVVPEREEYRYAADKWSIKEVVQHLNDTERILSYRALRFARNDATELAGFEENDYVPEAETGRRTLEDLMREHNIIRQATIALFNSFTPEMLLRSGSANGKRISVRALGWSIAGHAMHHADILEQRYN